MDTKHIEKAAKAFSSKLHIKHDIKDGHEYYTCLVQYLAIMQIHREISGKGNLSECVGEEDKFPTFETIGTLKDACRKVSPKTIDVSEWVKLRNVKKFDRYGSAVFGGVKLESIIVIDEDNTSIPSKAMVSIAKALNALKEEIINIDKASLYVSYDHCLFELNLSGGWKLDIISSLAYKNVPHYPIWYVLELEESFSTLKKLRKE